MLSLISSFVVNSPASTIIIFSFFPFITQLVLSSIGIGSQSSYQTSLAMTSSQPNNTTPTKKARKPASKKSNKKPSKPLEPVAKWSLYPALHDEVSQLLGEEGIHCKFRAEDAEDDDESIMKAWDTHIMGRFVCPNDSCKSKGWNSKKISITIRLYENGYYNARVYHQQCRPCGSHSRPILDQSYAERVAYWLKKWHGVQMEKPPVTMRRDGPPHQSDLCEGCKAGHCKEGLVTSHMVNLFSRFSIAC